MQLWVIDLSSGERESLTDGSQPLCCFGWVQGQSGIAYYAFKQPGSRDFEHYPITMTVAHLASDSLVILEEKQFNEVSRFASVSPNGYSLAYHDGDGAWIIQDDHSVEFFDAKTYGKNMPPDAILTNPAWSSDGSRIAWAISGTFGEEYQTALVVFNLNSKTSYQLHQYDAIEGTHSIQWFRPQTVWSPDNNWIAFEASDAAFGDDNGVWAFGSNDMQKHHIGSMEVIGWSWDSEHLCHRFKDYGGYVDVPGWEEHRLTFLPFDNWRFIGWTTPVRNEL
jgi:Tol biopolymer transport system component